MTSSSTLPPLDHSIVTAVSGFVERFGSRDTAKRPSHSDLKELFRQCELLPGDPSGPGNTVGKQKRVEACLTWALDHRPHGGQRFVHQLIRQLQGWGGFREDSENFVGHEAVKNAQAAFAAHGWDLSGDGSLLPMNIETLSGADLTEALKGYAKRSMEGADDSALVSGTAKDLLEATARHVLLERGTPRNVVEKLHFSDLLGMAFSALDMATPKHPQQPGEGAEKELERALYGAALAVNKLRNREGTGHGRPWKASLSAEGAATAARVSGTIAHRFLIELQK